MPHRAELVDISLQMLLLGPKSIGHRKFFRGPLVGFRLDLAIERFQGNLASPMLQSPSRGRILTKESNCSRVSGSLGTRRSPHGASHCAAAGRTRRIGPEVAFRIGTQHAIGVPVLTAPQSGQNGLVAIVKHALAVRETLQRLGPISTSVWGSRLGATTGPHFV